MTGSGWDMEEEEGVEGEGIDGMESGEGWLRVEFDGVGEECEGDEVWKMSGRSIYGVKFVVVGRKNWKVEVVDWKW